MQVGCPQGPGCLVLSKRRDRDESGHSSPGSLSESNVKTGVALGRPLNVGVRAGTGEVRHHRSEVRLSSGRIRGDLQLLAGGQIYERARSDACDGVDGADRSGYVNAVGFHYYLLVMRRRCATHEQADSRYGCKPPHRTIRTAMSSTQPRPTGSGRAPSPPLRRSRPATGRTGRSSARPFVRRGPHTR